MFLGYQDGKIAFIAETKEELENLPCVTFDRIEETSKEYFLHNGEYVYEIPAPTHEEVRQARSQAYVNEVDPLMAEYNRKKLFELFTENEETELLEKIESAVKTIKENNPYPVEE